MLKAFYQELQAKTAVQVQTIHTYRAYLAAEDQKVVNSCTVVLPEGGCESLFCMQWNNVSFTPGIVLLLSKFMIEMSVVFIEKCGTSSLVC